MRLWGRGAAHQTLPFLRHALQKAPQPGIGVGPYLLRGPDRRDTPLVHEGDARRNLPRELQLVGDDEHRAPLVGEQPDDVQDLPNAFRVQRRGRLVEEHDGGVDRQGASYPDPLGLPAAQLDGVGVGLVLHPHEHEDPRGLLPGIPAGHTLHRDHRLQDVLQGGLVDEKVVVLKDHREGSPQAVQGPPSQTPEVEGGSLVDAERPLVGPLQPDEAAQQGRLPRPARPQEGEHLPVPDLEVYPIQHPLFSKRFPQPGYPKHAAPPNAGMRGSAEVPGGAARGSRT